MQFRELLRFLFYRILVYVSWIITVSMGLILKWLKWWIWDRRITDWMWRGCVTDRPFPILAFHRRGAISSDLTLKAHLEYSIFLLLLTNLRPEWIWNLTWVYVGWCGWSALSAVSFTTSCMYSSALSWPFNCLSYGSYISSYPIFLCFLSKYLELWQK